MPDYSEGICEYCRKPYLACNGKQDCTEPEKDFEPEEPDSETTSYQEYPDDFPSV